MQLTLMKGKSNSDRAIRGHNRLVLYRKKMGFRNRVERAPCKHNSVFSHELLMFMQQGIMSKAAFELFIVILLRILTLSTSRP